MTLPTSGTLTLSGIGAEYGLTPPFSLSQLYRGGANVGSAVAAGTGSYQTAPMTPNAGPVQISTSGILEMSHFYGTNHSTGPVDSVVVSGNANCSQSDFPTGTTSCFVRFNSDGTVTHGGSGGGSINHYTGPTTWNTLNGGSIDYSSEYKFVITSISTSVSSGTYTPTTIGNQGNICDVSALAGPNKAVSVTYTVQIVRLSDSAVMATFTIGLNLDNT